MTRWLSIVAAAALMLGSGYANGVWNDRWGVSTELEQTAGRLPRVPINMGDWYGTDTADAEFTKYLIKRGTLHALVSRTYQNFKSGQTIALLMATGRPGPIAAHNPLTCIGNDATGMEMVTAPAVVSLSVGGKTAVFSYADFRNPKEPRGDGIRVYWSWRNPKQGWIANSSNDPRLTFASYRALTKIYVTQPLPAGGGAAPAPGDANADPAARFLKDCLPAIDAALAGTSG